MAYEIEFAEAVRDHMRSLTAQQRVTILDEIERQLINEPLFETRNRKPLRPNPLAPWELRAGDLRVFYDVSQDEQIVFVVAVGIKIRNQLHIGGKVITL